MNDKIKYKKTNFIENTDKARKILENYRDNLNNYLQVDSPGYILNEELNEYKQKFIKEIRSSGEHIYLYSYSKWFGEEHQLDKAFLSNSYNMNDVFEGTIADIDEGVFQEEELECFYKQAYIKCFTENANEIAMWGMYANNGTGLCIQYDLSRLENAESMVYNLYPVVYSANRLTQLSYDDLEDGHMTSEDVGHDVCWLINKSEQWKKEKEFRIISFDKTVLPVNCISQVICGPKMSKCGRCQLEWKVKEYESKYGYSLEILDARISRKEFTFDYYEHEYVSKCNC